MSTIFQEIRDNQEELKDKIDSIETKAQRKAEKKVRYERIIEMARSMNFWEKVELIMKII
jgi:septal ring factor EnvC (AmiA/AmiB activator)